MGSYSELVQAQRAEETARLQAIARREADQRQQLRETLAPLAAQVVLRREAEAERARLIATQQLHEIEDVFSPDTATDLADFLSHQAREGHPHAIVFTPPARPIALTPEAPVETPPQSSWSIWSSIRRTPAPVVEPPAAEVFQQLEEPSWMRRGYVLGATDAAHWVSGLPEPQLAVLFTDGTVGQVASRVSADGGRLEPITTEFPEPLQIGADGRPVVPVLGAFSGIQHDILNDGSDVMGAAFVVPSEAHLLLMRLGVNGSAPAHMQ